jgi:transcription elongation factor Elf1
MKRKSVAQLNVKEMLPCPFCGERKRLVLQIMTDNGLAIECQRCGALGPTANVLAKDNDSPRTRQLWNKRFHFRAYRPRLG